MKASTIGIIAAIFALAGTIFVVYRISQQSQMENLHSLGTDYKPTLTAVPTTIIPVLTTTHTPSTTPTTKTTSTPKPTAKPIQTHTPTPTVSHSPTPTNTPTPTSTATPSPTPKTVAVSISGHAFHPSSLTINSGDTVIWTNNDSAAHDVIFGGFSSNTLQNGDTYQHTFNSPGTFGYTCDFHINMDGTITVE